MSELWKNVVTFWNNRDVEVQPPVSLEEIDQFESENNLVFPTDFRQYLLTANGTGDDCDDEMFRFWSLSEIKSVEDELAGYKSPDFPYEFTHPNCYVFADYMIWSWAYAIQLSDSPDQPGPVFRVTNGAESEGELISPSFRGFMRQYLVDSMYLL